jgi:hypothetical protein
MVNTNTLFVKFLFLRFIDYYGEGKNEKELKLHPVTGHAGTESRGSLSSALNRGG